MRRRPAGVLVLALAFVAGAAALAANDARAQLPSLHGPAPREEEMPPEKPHRAGELECQTCHQGKHVGVVRMYLGMGGRGTPMIPSHMFQVRVECVACHVTPKEGERAAGIVGQTFRPSEQACLGCHGEKYRGMLGRWTQTLVRMREAIAPKVAAATAALKAADAKSPKTARARKLAEDAEFNMQFVTFGKGVHNVFYAADLLKLANGWLDESLALLGTPAPKVDDKLVRGGYCGVLCHEQAGVKQPETVKYGALRVPHVRHVTEFGAVCTACHSAEVHKAVTAKPATCAGCHHSPQNERCESCHRAQSAFYRGEAKSGLATLEPNVMVNAVTCTGCHDFSHKHSRQAVGQKCIGCHDASYAGFVTEWTTGLDQQTARATEAIRRAEAAIAKERRAGRKTPEADALLREARDATALVRKARAVHNPTGAESLLDAAAKKAEQAAASAARK